MINVKEYSGHIRNWSALCERLGIDHSLSREDREAQILIKAYESSEQSRFIIMRQQMVNYYMGQPSVRSWSSRGL